jgi:NitT/TauT family transport system substrate-binding protein
VSGNRIGARALAAGLAVVIAVVMAACGDKPQESGEGPRPIKLAGVFCLCHMGPYVAWKKGFFEKEGVPVDDYVFTQAGADTFQALASGDVDFGVSGIDAIIRGRQEGVKVRSVADVYPDFYALSVREDLAGEIRSPADLKGRRVGVSKIGSASWAFLQGITRREGLAEDDVEVLQLGEINTIVAGLKSRKADAAITWEPGTTQMEEQGIGTALFNALNPADHQKLLGSPTSISMTLAVRDQLIEENPEVVERAVRALDEASKWIKQATPEEVADLIAPLATGIDREVLVKAVTASIPAQPDSTAVSRKAYELSTKELQSAGVIEEVPDLEEAFSCKFAECVE